MTCRAYTCALWRACNSSREEISAGHCPSLLQDLAVSTGRTARTIKRDVRALRADFKAPLLYDRQRKGFRYTEQGSRILPQARFSEGELLAFFTAHHVMHALAQNPEATLLQNALAKLATFLPKQVTFNPNTIRTALTFEATPHVMVEPYLLQTLTHAALTQRTLSVQYYSQHRNELTERRIDVLHLHNFTGDWYAIAFDHRSQEVRDFHVGRIRHLQETNTFFTPPPDWSADAHLRRGFSMMRGGRLTTVSLVFDAYQARSRIRATSDLPRGRAPRGFGGRWPAPIFPIGS